MLAFIFNILFSALNKFQHVRIMDTEVLAIFTKILNFGSESEEILEEV